MKQCRLQPMMSFAGLSWACLPKYAWHTALLLTLASSGCVSHAPTAPVTPANAHLLQRVYKAKVADHGWLPMVEYNDLIGDVAIDPARHRMYFNRSWTAGLLPSLVAYVPVGISTVDLRSGFEIHRTRVPTAPDMTGDAVSGGGRFVLDTERTHAYALVRWFRGWPLDLGSTMAYSDRYGDNSVGLVKFDLDEDAPHLVTHNVEFLPHPEVDANRAALLTGGFEYDNRQIKYLDRSSGAIVGHVRCMPFDRRGSEQLYRGGIDDFVLAWTSTPRSELFILESDGGELKPANRLELEEGVRCWHDAIDWQHRRWVVAQSRRVSSDQIERRVRVYDVPSLKVICELPASAFGNYRGMHLVQKTSLLLVVPEEDDQSLALFDLNTGREITRQPLEYWGWPPFQTWAPIADPEGIYVGACGQTWVNLFAVQPERGNR